MCVSVCVCIYVCLCVVCARVVLCECACDGMRDFRLQMVYCILAIGPYTNRNYKTKLCTQTGRDGMRERARERHTHSGHTLCVCVCVCVCVSVCLGQAVSAGFYFCFYLTFWFVYLQFFRCLILFQEFLR